MFGILDRTALCRTEGTLSLCCLKNEKAIFFLIELIFWLLSGLSVFGRHADCVIWDVGLCSIIKISDRAYK